MANPSATWSLTGTSGGVTGTDLSPTSGASTTFTGHLIGTATVHAVAGTLSANTGLVTVSAGTATALTIETAANGSGSAITTKAVTAGGDFTGYAITRDTYGNFVANPSATWSLTGTSGGVTGTDLSPTSGASTTFTGHLIGTATVHAWRGPFSANAGLVTVERRHGHRSAHRDRANGSGSANTAKAVTAGGKLTGYAITARNLRQLRGQPERHLEHDQHQRRGHQQRPEPGQRRLDHLHRPPRRQRHGARRGGHPHRPTQAPSR